MLVFTLFSMSSLFPMLAIVGTEWKWRRWDTEALHCKLIIKQVGQTLVREIACCLGISVLDSNTLKATAAR